MLPNEKIMSSNVSTTFCGIREVINKLKFCVKVYYIILLGNVK